MIQNSMVFDTGDIFLSQRKISLDVEKVVFVKFLLKVTRLWMYKCYKQIELCMYIIFSTNHFVREFRT